MDKEKKKASFIKAGGGVIRAFDGKRPKIAKSAFISEAAYVIGDVEIGENSSV